MESKGHFTYSGQKTQSQVDPVLKSLFTNTSPAVFCSQLQDAFCPSWCRSRIAQYLCWLICSDAHGQNEPWRIKVDVSFEWEHSGSADCFDVFSSLACVPSLLMALFLFRAQSLSPSLVTRWGKEFLVGPHCQKLWSMKLCVHWLWPRFEGLNFPEVIVPWISCASVGLRENW